MSSFKSIAVQENVLGSKVTTLAIGGPLKSLAVIDSVEELIPYLEELRDRGEVISILGAGSNVLISDAGVSGVVLQLGKSFRHIEKLSSQEFKIGAATSLMSSSRKLSNDGFSGLEFAGGIPGQWGGSIFMNAGAHGGDVSQVVKSISAINLETSELVYFEKKDLEWKYRSSGLPKKMLVLGATIILTPGSQEKISAHLSACLEERRRRQPLTLPSCGSVFKNPSNEVSAGAVIEQAGLKGFQHGSLQVSEMHANWIVNPNKTGTAKEFVELMKIIKDRVSDTCTIELQEEVRVWNS